MHVTLRHGSSLTKQMTYNLIRAQQLLRWATVSEQRGPKSGGDVHLSVRELGPHLKQCHLGRGLPPHQVPSWSIQPFGHNTPTLQKDSKTGRQDRTDNGPIAQGEPFYKRSLKKLYFLQPANWELRPKPTHQTAKNFDPSQHNPTQSAGCPTDPTHG